MSQSRKMSALEVVTSTVVGLAVSLVANAVILPLLGFDISTRQNMLLVTIYTFVSIARGYCVRRLFEWLALSKTA